VTVWNDAEYSQRLTHANWMANTAVLMYLNERATGDPARDWLSSWAHRWFAGSNLRVLVLGCGEGWLERAVAAWPFVAHIDAVDFAADAVARARESARGLDKIRYGVVDLNRDELPRDTYDVVVAHSVLHHVANLEHAYAQIEASMRPDATLVINEYIGPNRFQYGDDVLSIMNALLRCLPPELRGPYEVRTRPTVEEMIANDPTEAVRAEELLAFTEKHFEILARRNLGGTILQHLLFDIVQHFRFDNPRDRSIVELLCTIEAMLVDRGRIESDFVLLAARKKGSHATRAPRPLPPRPREAFQLDPDPLGLTSPARTAVAQRSEHVSRRADWKPVLRLLRQALASQQEARAPLFRESALLGIRERLLARGSDPWTHLLRRAPADPAIRALLETAATLASA